MPNFKFLGPAVWAVRCQISQSVLNFIYIDKQEFFFNFFFSSRYDSLQVTVALERKHQLMELEDSFDDFTSQKSVTKMNPKLHNILYFFLPTSKVLFYSTNNAVFLPLTANCSLS